MSNKVVPTVYRSIIDSVIENVRPDFDEVGVEEAVLQELLRSWEHKVAISRVADFSNDRVMAPAARDHPPLAAPHLSNPAHARTNPSHRTASNSNTPVSQHPLPLFPRSLLNPPSRRPNPPPPPPSPTPKLPQKRTRSIPTSTTQTRRIQKTIKTEQRRETSSLPSTKRSPSPSTPSSLPSLNATLPGPASQEQVEDYAQGWSHLSRRQGLPLRQMQWVSTAYPPPFRAV